jgi:uncharacterized protein YdhG (YjbR/CyaY superfamily)
MTESKGVSVSKKRKVKSGGSSTKRGSVDKYLAGISEPARSTLKKMRAVIRSAVPDGTTETISYGIPAFKYGNYVVWYAAFSKHCSLFPTAAVIAAFKSELKPFKISKGTIQFPVDQSLPAALVRQMVRARIADIESK